MQENARRSSSLNEPYKHAINVTEVFIRGAARMLELQAAAARTLMETQGRTASMFGAPDLSPLLTRNGQLTDLITTSAQQALAIARQTNETLAEVQEQIVRLMETQTSQLTDQVRRSTDKLAQQAEDGMRELRATAERAIEEARSAAEEDGEEEPSSRGTNGKLQGSQARHSKQQNRAKATAKR
jgi:gas vesicle protein